MTQPQITRECPHCLTAPDELNEDNVPCLYVFHLGRANYQVYCRTCDATGPQAASHTGAIERWNHRKATKRKPRGKRGRYKRREGMEKRLKKHEDIIETIACEVTEGEAGRLSVLVLIASATPQPKIVCAECGAVLDVEYDDNNNEYRAKICQKCMHKNDDAEYQRGKEIGHAGGYEFGLEAGRDGRYNEGIAQGRADYKEEMEEEKA